jgi:hypothetical protein
MKQNEKTPRSDVRCVWVTVRGVTGHDPGELAPAYYVIDGDLLSLTDADGEPLEGDVERRTCRLRVVHDPDREARRLKRNLLSGGQAFFGRALEYERLVVV